MPSSQFDPGHEKAVLGTAIMALANRWETPRMGEAIAALHVVLTRAEGVLAALAQDPLVDTDAANHVLGLSLQVEYAKEELHQAEQALHVITVRQQRY